MKKWRVITQRGRNICKEGLSVLESILNETASSITMTHMAVCTAVSLGLGSVLAGIHTYRNQSSRNFLMTLVLLPVIVQMVIMLVNGNLGTGVAVKHQFFSPVRTKKKTKRSISLQNRSKKISTETES